MNNLASQYFRRGLYAEAGRLFSDLIAVRRRVLGHDHPNTLIAMNNLATVYRAEGKYAEAEPIFVDVLEIRRRVLGEEHPDTLRTLNALASLYGLAGRYRTRRRITRKCSTPADAPSAPIIPTR